MEKNLSHTDSWEMSYREFLECTIPREEYIWLCENKAFLELGHDFIRTGQVPQKDSFVFLAALDWSLLEKCLKQCSESPYRYVVIVAKHDATIDEQVVKMLPQNVLHLYGTNVEVDHPRITGLPVGRDFRGSSVFLTRGFQIADPDRRKLAYCNFSLDTNHSNRSSTYDTLRMNVPSPNSWITFEHMGQYLHYSISHAEYYQNVCNHKFIIAPEGNGIDCYRTWDALYLKAIPVVQRSRHMQRYCELPILFTEDYSELSAEYLEAKYEQMLDTRFNFRSLLFSFWTSRIRSSLAQCSVDTVTSQGPCQIDR